MLSEEGDRITVLFDEVGYRTLSWTRWPRGTICSPW
ncbi:hypothetical protein ACFQ3Z_07475 [Streptomyces nogalater]